MYYAGRRIEGVCLVCVCECACVCVHERLHTCLCRVCTCVHALFLCVRVQAVVYETVQKAVLVVPCEGKHAGAILAVRTNAFVSVELGRPCRIRSICAHSKHCWSLRFSAAQSSLCLCVEVQRHKFHPSVCATAQRVMTCYNVMHTCSC